MWAVSDVVFMTLSTVMLLQILHVDATYEFPAFRLVQYDKQGASLGSRRTTLSHMATGAPLFTQSDEDANTPATDNAAQTGDNSRDDDDDDEVGGSARDSASKDAPSRAPRGAGSLSRQAVVVRLDDIASQAQLDQLLDEHRAGGLLIVLPTPEKLEEALSSKSANVARWKRIEQYLLNRESQSAVYFAFEDEQLASIVDSVAGSSSQVSSMLSTNEHYQLVVGTAEAEPIQTTTVYNFQGWLHSTPAQGRAAQGQSTIAVVANYDTFGAVPELSFGTDQNGSGVVALLELARIFSRLYSDSRNHGTYNFLFVLTGAGRMNFAGIKHWLNNVDQRVLESIEMAVCLDAIGSADSDSHELFLHVSKPEKKEEVKAIYNTFRTVAKDMGVPFEIVHKKVDINNPVVDWQHEQFSRKRILAGTLSSNRAPTPLFSRGSLFDRRVNQTVLLRNIRFIGEVLCRRVFQGTFSSLGAASTAKSSSFSVLQSSNAVNSNFVSAWLEFLSTQPRVSPLLHRKSTVLVELESVLSKHTAEVFKTTFALDSTYKFYTSAPTPMSAYIVKPFIFDLFLFVGTSALLVVLHFASLHVSKGL